MNKVILIGHVGQDPEIRVISDELKVASFSLATSKSYKNKNGEKETKTEWHNITAWKGLAKLAELYIKKGSKISVIGEINYQQYESDGIKKYSTKITVTEIELLDKKGDNKVKPTVTENDVPPNIENKTDDLPF